MLKMFCMHMQWLWTESLWAAKKVWKPWSILRTCQMESFICP